MPLPSSFKLEEIMWNHSGCKFWGGAQVESLVLPIPKNEATYTWSRKWHYNNYYHCPFALGSDILANSGSAVCKVAHTTVSVNELQHVENEHRYIIASNWHMHMMPTIMHSCAAKYNYKAINYIMLTSILLVSCTCNPWSGKQHTVINMYSW